MADRDARTLGKLDADVVETEAREDRADDAKARELRRRSDHVDRRQGVEKGKAVRRAVPRSLHATWAPPPGRRGAVEILAEQASSRETDLLPIRNGRMLASAFAFYRGGAAVMASDLAGTPASGLTVQLCGDAHLANFGGYASPERDLVFDVNDFDETLPGPFEWDVKRLAASIAIAGRGAGLPAGERRRATEAAVAQYRTAMRDLAGRTELGVWYARLDEALLVERERTVGRKAVLDLKRRLAGAKPRDDAAAFSKLAAVVHGEPRIVARPPLVVPLRDLPDGRRRAREEELDEILGAYRRSLQPDVRRLLARFRAVDIARKIVGVGSIGMQCWVVLLMGRDEADPLFLQVKEAQDSVLMPYARRSIFANQGERVVVGQRLMQAASDLFLGWTRVIGRDNRARDFYVRQLWDWKVAVDPATVTSANLASYGRLCGWTLARAHARSGDRIAISAYLGSGPAFEAAIASFAEAYADQNERDFEDFAAAVKAGKVPAETGT